MKISNTYLNECFELDAVKGLLRWKQRPITHFHSERIMKTVNTKYAGKIAGGLTTQGYIAVRINDELFLAHRVIFQMHYGYEPAFEIDHINRRKRDNRIKNLRPATSLQNSYNKARYKNNKSGLKGVWYVKGKGMFRSQIQTEGKRISLGYFKTAKEAHEAYRKAEKSLHKEFSVVEV